MVRHCFVEMCNSTRYKAKEVQNSICVSLYRFPSNPEIRKKWVEALITLNSQDNALNMPKSAMICAKHFEENCFEKSGLSCVRLKPHSIPSLFPRAENKRLAVPSTDNCHEDSSQEQSLQMMDVSNVPKSNNQHHTITTPLLEILCSPKKKKIRYAGDISDDLLEEMTPKTLRQSIRLLREVCKKKDHKIKRLQSLQNRQTKKLESLQTLLSDLKRNCLLSSNTCDIIQCSTEEKSIIKEIERGKVNGQYSPQLRSFALTLNFYSPKAYTYVREVYKNKLPAPSTLRSWYANTNGSPGFTQEAIDILKKKSEAGDKKIYATLMMDEMAIRKQLEWSHSEKKFVGYVDCGTLVPESDSMPLAKEALVYLLTGINERWKIPVAYFYIHSLTSQERVEITMQVLEFIASSKVNVIALTFDGLPANITMCTELKADVYNNRPYFRHPTYDHDIIIFFDAAHMLKLIRTTWATKGVLYDNNGNPIKWEFIEKLARLQKNGYFHLANKISDKHVQWQKNKMSVKLAAQTLSESCATALQLLMEEGHPDFLECAATIKFLRIVNNIFDCLNSRSMFSHGFKRPLRQDTASEMFCFFAEAIQ